MPSPSVSVVTVSGTPSKLVQLLRKRLRQLLRVVVGLAACVAVAATALAIWWLNSLNGLPDIGDPFYDRAFRCNPASTSARLTFLRRGPWKDHAHGDGGREWGKPGVEFSGRFVSDVREWAENREAFELFQQGAEQADAANPAEDPNDGWFIHGGLFMLALLEASRREESGDTASIWDCHRAVIRMITHLRRRGNTLQRQNARVASRPLQRRLTDWATGRPRSPNFAGAGSRAENEPKPEWNLFAVKYGYLELMEALERPIPPSALQDIELEWTFRLGDLSISPEIVGQLEAARRFLQRVPEESGASFDCSVPTTWRTRKPAGAVRRNRPSSRR